MAKTTDATSISPKRLEETSNFLVASSPGDRADQLVDMEYLPPPVPWECNNALKYLGAILERSRGRNEIQRALT